MKFHCKPPFMLSHLRSLSSSSISFCSISHHRSSFGIAFDIDGVVLRGRTPIGNSSGALRRLFDDSGELRILEIVQGHSPFRGLLKRFENEFIVATGKGEPAAVMSEYGFRKVISLEEYASCFNNIDPVAQYKRWNTEQASMKPNVAESTTGFNVASDKVKAAFIVSDPVDWGRDIQVLCDILTSGGLLGEENEYQPPLYFSADDLQYQAAFPSERLGMGAFRIALESVFNRIQGFSALTRGLV